MEQRPESTSADLEENLKSIDALVHQCNTERAQHAIRVAELDKQLKRLANERWLCERAIENKKQIARAASIKNKIGRIIKEHPAADRFCAEKQNMQQQLQECERQERDCRDPAQKRDHHMRAYNVSEDLREFIEKFRPDCPHINNNGDFLRPLPAKRRGKRVLICPELGDSRYCYYRDPRKLYTCIICDKECDRPGCECFDCNPI
jgi:hypothetical protein